MVSTERVLQFCELESEEKGLQQGAAEGKDNSRNSGRCGAACNQVVPVVLVANIETGAMTPSVVSSQESPDWAKVGGVM